MADGRPSIHHVTEPRREVSWPYQWLGSCSCGRAIRCNSDEVAAEFLDPCRAAPTDGGNR